jgi:hypothetical protein
VRRLLVIAAGVMLAGCGGGGERLSASEYRSKADAICRAANQKLKGLGNPSTPGNLRSLVKKAKPIAKDAIDDLAALEPPKELESRVDDWNRKNEELLARLDELSEEKDLVKLQGEAQAFSDLNDETNRYARTALGLRDCAEG